MRLVILYFREDDMAGAKILAKLLRRARQYACRIAFAPQSIAHGKQKGAPMLRGGQIRLEACALDRRPRPLGDLTEQTPFGRAPGAGHEMLRRHDRAKLAA